ncbi:glycoside hydrolase family 32 protein [Zhouia sp. PK063]|uniref:glycoside hydrolase family 32 protein n=1 Tax=Zhouia sp. PK063 TaxID=3373602 RepID=UPI0037B22494
MNKILKGTALLAGVVLLLAGCKQHSEKKEEVATEMQKDTLWYQENYRPQFHFSPIAHWMNDPNGLVYNDGIYHLFYQYYPKDIVWGPMHWGHATSNDLIHWEHKPIALYPDSLGYIFSGSAVVDKNNTTGFAKNGETPLVAIYTYHDPVGAEKGTNTYQTQGIAYSLDNGDTWSTYENNPVIGNEGQKDFRDPKVFWYEKGNYWVLSLVAGDHAQLYKSQDLKSWKLMSTFGQGYGDHGGVWECPDLFKMKVEGTTEERWVLFISINPGGPNSGSATQYFVGDFDGEKFTTTQKGAKWVDHGTDDYAGVTYNNTPNGERIFLGWMSNWNYGQKVPTKTWRSAMTLPRDLKLTKINKQYYLESYPIKAFHTIVEDGVASSTKIAANEIFSKSFEKLNQSVVSFTTQNKNFKINLKNNKGDVMTFVADGDRHDFYIDRSKSGIVDFEKDFSDHLHHMNIADLSTNEYEVKLVIDVASVELFLNKGQYVMTDIMFPQSPYTSIEVLNTSNETMQINNLKIQPVKSIW